MNGVLFNKQEQVISYFQTANRLGSIPLIGTCVGVIRTVGALVITTIALIALLAQKAALGPYSKQISHALSLSIVKTSPYTILTKLVYNKG